MLPKGITLRGLEVFEALAATGSVAKAADRTGLSQPAVSQQVRNLEQALASELIDHGRRPMRLTPAGEGFLARAKVALSELRRAQTELKVMDLAHLSSLSIGIIDDFDSNLTPRLVTSLADSLTHSRFKMVSSTTHEILAALTAKKLHLAVAGSTGAPINGVLEYPLAREPFMIVTPKDAATADTLPACMRALPFLRYDRSQLIGRQIEALLPRLDTPLDDRFEVGSHLALIAMVAQRIGWAITTPLGFMRAVRFHDRVDCYALPDVESSRTISLFCSTDWAGTVPTQVAATMRGMIQTHMIDPGVSRLPWLGGRFCLIEEPTD